MTGELSVTLAHRPDCGRHRPATRITRLPWRKQQPAPPPSRPAYLSETYTLLCGGYAWSLTCVTCGQQTTFRVTDDKQIVPLEGTDVYGTPANIYVLTGT